MIDGQEKKVTVVHAESGGMTDLAILPGTTARDVKQHVGLGREYVLTKGKGAEPFGNSDNLYEELPDGAQIYATTPVSVGFIGRGGHSPLPFSFKIAIIIALAIAFLLASRLILALLPIVIALLFLYSVLVIFGGDGFHSLIPLNGIGRRIKDLSFPSPSNQKASKVVQRNATPYWRKREWRQIGNVYHGYFTGNRNYFKGSIYKSPSGQLRIRIKDPPITQIERNTHHGPCFIYDQNGYYNVHINRSKRDVSSALLEVDQVLEQAMRDKAGDQLMIPDSGQIISRKPKKKVRSLK